MGMTLIEDDVKNWYQLYLFSHTEIVILLYSRLDREECERALLPTLEHASLVHSHIHHLTDQSEEAFLQTRNAIVYISVSKTI